MSFQNGRGAAPRRKTLGLAVKVIDGAQGTVLAYRCSQRNAVLSQRNVEVGNVVRSIAMRREFKLEREGCRSAISGNLRDPVQRFGEVGLQDALDVAQLARGQGNSLIRIDPYLVAALSLVTVAGLNVVKLFSAHSSSRACLLSGGNRRAAHGAARVRVQCSRSKRRQPRRGRPAAD